MVHDDVGRSMKPAPELVEIPQCMGQMHTSSGGESGLDRYGRDSSVSMPPVGYSPLCAQTTGGRSHPMLASNHGAGTAAPTPGGQSLVDSVDQTVGYGPSEPRPKPPFGYSPLGTLSQGARSLLECDQTQGVGTAAPNPGTISPSHFYHKNWHLAQGCATR